MIRRFLQDSAIYSIPLVLSRGLGFFLLPVYTRYLSPADYGLIEILAIFYSLLNLTMPLEISQGVARFLPEAEGQNQKIAYAATGFWFTAFVFVLFAIFCWLFPEMMSRFLFGSSESGTLVQVGSLAMFSNALMYVIQSQLRWSLQPKASATIGVTFSFVTASFTVLLIVVYQQGVYGYVFGQLAGATVALLAGLFLARNFVPVRFVFDFEKFKEMLSFSLPLVLSSIAVYVSMYTDRWMIRLFGDVADVGVYSVAYRVASVSALAIATFQMALTPIIYSHYKEPETPKKITVIFALFLALVFPGIAFIGAFSSELLSWLVSAEFYEAHNLIVVLVAAVVLMNIYVFSPGLGLAKKTKKIAAVNTISAIINVSLNAVLIPMYGLMGASLATLSSGVTMAFFYFRWGQREYPIPFQWQRYSLAFMCLLGFLLLVTFVPLSVLSKGFTFLLCAIIIVVTLLGARECMSFFRQFAEKLRE